MRRLQIFALMASLAVVMTYQACGPMAEPVGPSELDLPSFGEDVNPPLPAEPPPAPPAEPPPPTSTCPVPSTGRILYVNAATGNDATTYAANSTTSPWRTIGRAAWGSTSSSSPNSSQAAQPGDVVSIASGIYWESGVSNGTRFSVSLNPINSGTADRPIIFRGVGRVEVRLLAGFRGGMIGCNSRNYIIWDNFYINDYYGGSTSDTGPVVFNSARHCQIINSEVRGHSGSYYHGYPTFGGNYRGISLEPADHIVIRNNRIHNFLGGQNEAAIMSYDSNDNIIENNEIYNSGTGIFIKGVHPGFTQNRNIIRKNLLYNHSYSAIRVLGSEDARVYQNIIFNNPGTGVHIGFTQSARSRVYNNTLYQTGTGFSPQARDLVDVQFYNNLIVGSTQRAIFDWGALNPSEQDVSFERNLYYNNAQHANYEAGARAISFADWQSVYGLDTTSLVADPMFVNASAANFRLQANSPARNLGRDLLDFNNNGDRNEAIPAGAYITGNEEIGLSSACD